MRRQLKYLNIVLSVVAVLVKSHFQLKHAQARVGVSARHRELVDAKFRL